MGKSLVWPHLLKPIAFLTCSLPSPWSDLKVSNVSLFKTYTYISDIFVPDQSRSFQSLAAVHHSERKTHKIIKDTVFILLFKKSIIIHIIKVKTLFKPDNTQIFSNSKIHENNGDQWIDYDSWKNSRAKRGSVNLDNFHQLFEIRHIHASTNHSHLCGSANGYKRTWRR